MVGLPLSHSSKDKPFFRDLRRPLGEIKAGSTSARLAMAKTSCSRSRKASTLLSFFGFLPGLGRLEVDGRMDGRLLGAEDPWLGCGQLEPPLLPVPRITAFDECCVSRPGQFVRFPENRIMRNFYSPDRSGPGTLLGEAFSSLLELAKCSLGFHWDRHNRPDCHLEPTRS
jgi:hypothetical protein